MRKVYFIFLIIISVALAGCLPQGQATPTPTATEIARPTPTVALTVPTQPAVSQATGCTVVTQKPTPGPTPASIFPPVTDTEWVKGPAGAKVTIIEYADFQ